jgi:hypothetical protein
MNDEQLFRKFHPLCLEAYEPGNRDTFCVGSDRGFLLYEGNELHVVIAGSNDLMDWVADSGNIRFRARELQRGFNVHGGMLAAAEGIAKEVGKDIVQFLEGDVQRTVTFAGHSRGGGIAQILPVLMGLSLTRFCVITFAAPRVFSGDLAQYCAPATCVHFQRWNDVATMVPIDIPGHDYRHSGRRVRMEIGGVRSVGEDYRPGVFSVTSLVVAVVMVIIAGRIKVSLPLCSVKSLMKWILDAHSMTGGYSPAKWFGDK